MNVCFNTEALQKSANKYLYTDLSLLSPFFAPIISLSPFHCSRRHQRQNHELFYGFLSGSQWVVA
jgi:hypothetical protein